MEFINSDYCERQQCKRRGTEWSLLTVTTVRGNSARGGELNGVY